MSNSNIEIIIKKSRKKAGYVTAQASELADVRNVVNDNHIESYGVLNKDQDSWRKKANAKPLQVRTDVSIDSLAAM